MPPRDPNLDALWAEVRTSQPAWQLHEQRNRPMPRQMRAPEIRARATNPGVRRQAEAELNRRFAAEADPRTAPRLPRGNQFAEAGAMALEGTGLPSIRRGTAGVTRGAMNQDPMQGLGQVGAGAVELGLGGLGVAGLGVGGAPRLPPRMPAAIPEPMPRMTPPPREIAPNGLPIRPPEPFRNSMRGGSEDLAEAAAPRFDSGPLYRGHQGNPSTGHWRASEDGLSGPGVYLTNDEAQADYWALRQAESDPTVHTVNARGPIAEGMTYEEARAQGYKGLRYRGRNGYDETVIFDPADVSPSRSSRPARSPQAPDAGDITARAPDLPAQGATRPQAQGTSPAMAPPPRRGMFGRMNGPGVRDMQPDAILGDRLRRTVIDARTRRGDPSTIVVNPSREDILRMTRVPRGAEGEAWQHDTLRYIRDADGNVYVANGASVTHDDMARALRERDMLPAGYQFEAAAYDGHGGTVSTGLLRRSGDKITSNHPTIFERGMFGQ